MPARHRPSAATRPDAAPAPPLDAATVDALYGLEPVYEPGTADGDAAGDAASFVAVECPYCWETYDTPVDLSAGSFEYVEDCQVCCQPIELAVDVDDGGGVAAVRATRLQ